MDVRSFNSIRSPVVFEPRLTASNVPLCQPGPGWRSLLPGVGDAGRHERVATFMDHSLHVRMPVSSPCHDLARSRAVTGAGACPLRRRLIGSEVALPLAVCPRSASQKYKDALERVTEMNLLNGLDPIRWTSSKRWIRCPRVGSRTEARRRAPRATRKVRVSAPWRARSDRPRRARLWVKHAQAERTKDKSKLMKDERGELALTRPARFCYAWQWSQRSWPQTRTVASGVLILVRSPV